ncbi:MAG: tRNA (N(6)-L-threonylcarbamoyladenosine(37)-C(2))-methylthiotransferase [Candidatus Bathyarchaeia archaeon]|jgi:MiaB-like tRNA modifying enzyme
MRVLVKSFGCSTNFADGAILAGCLARAGYKLVGSVSSADVIVLNTCAVKGPTENRMIEISKRIPLEKKLIVAGCLPLINFERLQQEVSFSGAMGPAAGEGIVEVVNRVSKGEKVIALEETLNDLPKLNLPRLQSNPVTSIVPINYGCLGSCAYCCVVFARGRLRSYDIQDIVGRVREDLASGLREFWITSQDTACYGKDKGANLATLLHALCRIDEDFRVRVGMMTPNNALDILEELVQAFQDDRIFKFIHLPVQSGDDDVLKCMRRFYCVNDFKRVVEAFRARFPDITLATDVICGFPGETEEAFQRTLQLIEEVTPDIVNVSKFFARPKTAAAKMQKDSVPLSEIKRRSTMASTLAKRLSLMNNQRWVGWSGGILVDEVGKVPGSWVGRNFSYKPVAVKCASKLIGKFVPAKIIRAFPTYLESSVIQ